MELRTLIAVLGGMVCFGASMVRADQPAGTSPVPGYYDPRTRTFTALVDASAEAEVPSAAAAPTAAPKVVSGTLTIKATVTIVSSIPSSATFSTIGYLSGGLTYGPPTAELPSGRTAARGTATRSGSTVSATVSFPYRFRVDGSTTKLLVTLYVSSSVAGVPGLQVTQNIPIPTAGSSTTVSFPGAI